MSTKPVTWRVLEVLHLPLADVIAGRALHDVGTLSAAAAVGLATAALLRRERP